MEIVKKLYLKWCEFGGCKKFVTLAVTSVWRFLPMHGLSSSTRFFAWMLFHSFVTFFPHLFRNFVSTFAMDLSNCFTICSHFFRNFFPFCGLLRKAAENLQKNVYVHFFHTLQLCFQFTLFYTFFTVAFPIYTFLTLFLQLFFSHSPFCYTFYIFPTHTFFTLFWQLYFQFTLFLHFFSTLFLQLYFQFTLFSHFSSTCFSHFFHTFFTVAFPILHFFYTFLTLFVHFFCTKTGKKV